MSYKFNFAELPFRANRKKISRIEIDIKQEIPHKTVYKLVESAESLPENCTSVYYTNLGIFIELQVGVLSTAGDVLPKVEIYSITRIASERPH